VKEVWRAVELEQIRCILKEMQTPKEVVFSILKLDKLIQIKVVNLLWIWWNERNRRREGEKAC